MKQVKAFVGDSEWKFRCRQRDSNPRPSDPSLLASVSSLLMVRSQPSVSTMVGPHLVATDFWGPSFGAVAGIQVLTWTRTTQSMYILGSILWLFSTFMLEMYSQLNKLKIESGQCQGFKKVSSQNLKRQQAQKVSLYRLEQKYHSCVLRSYPWINYHSRDFPIAADTIPASEVGTDSGKTLTKLFF